MMFMKIFTKTGDYDLVNKKMMGKMKDDVVCWTEIKDVFFGHNR